MYTEMMTCSLFKKEDLRFPLSDLNFTLYAVMFIAILAGVAFFCLLCVKRSGVERNVYAFGRDGSASSSACTSVTLSPSGPAAPAPPERTSSNHFLFSILFPIFLSNWPRILSLKLCFINICVYLTWFNRLFSVEDSVGSLNGYFAGSD